MHLFREFALVALVHHCSCGFVANFGSCHHLDGLEQQGIGGCRHLDTP